MPNRLRRTLRFFFQALAALLALVALAALTLWWILRASLPTLDGTRPLTGLTTSVTIERDADGVPTVHAQSHEDMARALGFLHAQDRFLQMDLLRRQGAGELAELLGPAAIEKDQESRQHLFRRRAVGIVQAMTPKQRRLLDAYVEGVNEGLGALEARTWEYFALRATPRPWTREDSVLVIDAMAMTQETDGTDERSEMAIRQTYGDETLAFLYPSITEGSAALDGSAALAPPVPDATHFRPRPLAPGEAAPVPVLTMGAAMANPDEMPGSNAFALAGARTASGEALVANDPHLRLAVPNIWYRASLVLPERTVTGATLPGVPAVVVGSNGDIAWAFTNGLIDTCDLVLVEVDPADATRYRVPDGSGWEPFEVVRESIPVHSHAPEACEVLMTRWGPLVTRPAKGGPVYARHWSEYEPGGISAEMISLMDARTLDEALARAHRTGIHPQNLIVGDRAGNVAWTVIGQVPRRVGFDGRTPQSWADGTRRWGGFLSPDEVPVVRNPANGQLWSANNRAVGGDALTRLGDGGYVDPVRAAQLRDRLSALTSQTAQPADLLAIQLDDEARYLTRWRELLLRVLTDEAVAGQASLGKLREIVRAWNGHASTDAVGYRVVREFRRAVTEAVMDPIFAPVKQRDSEAEPGSYVQQPLWSILDARPAYLLPPSAGSWDNLLLDAARATADPGKYKPGGASLAECTWGQRNVLAMNHPLSRGLPVFIGRWLGMPAHSLPGDSNLPRVQSPNFGASLRMVVSPGQEDAGIYEQPGGASGHPLSPFYRAGHENWAKGRPSSFLPGPVRHQLELHPITIGK